MWINLLYSEYNISRLRSTIGHGFDELLLVASKLPMGRVGRGLKRRLVVMRGVKNLNTPLVVGSSANRKHKFAAGLTRSCLPTLRRPRL